MDEITTGNICGYKQLMRARLERFCGYDTSSITVERAQDVMRSTAYVVRAGMDAAAAEHMPVDAPLNAQECFDAGLRALADRMKTARAALNFARATAPAVDNIALENTLGAGLQMFFDRYETEFAAHEIPADIDYPLCLPVDDAREGLDYIEEYLRRITYENIFLARLDADELNAILKKRFASPREMIFNICGVALEYGMECAMRNHAPDVLEDGRAAYSRAAAMRAARELCAGMNAAAADYMINAAEDAANYVLLRTKKV